MIKTFFNALRVFICGGLTIQLMGCGTILYPERRGQKAGHIDVGVALLDGVGLLLFLIPGIIAFAVDFSNGTIYLPGTSRASLDLNNIKQIKFDPKHSSMASIERTIKDETGYSVKLDQDNLRISKLKSTDEMRMQFAILKSERINDQLALLK